MTNRNAIVKTSMRTLVILVLSFTCLFVADTYSQTVANSLVTNRQIYLRNLELSGISGSRRAINTELGVRRAANSSLRQSREALKRNRFIRKEKTKLKNDYCGKKYNSYVQHECYAYDFYENPRDSVLLQFNELVVLRKTKNDYYLICLGGQEFYVLRDEE